MMLPQSSSRTMTWLPGTACHPFFHHSGSAAVIELNDGASPVLCFFCHASRRFIAPRAALWKVRRTSLSVPAGVGVSSACSSCSTRWKVWRSFSRSSSECAGSGFSPGRGFSVGRRLNAGRVSAGLGLLSPFRSECSESETSGSPGSFGRGVRWTSSSSE